MKLTVHAFTTLDGVMQGPGSPDEDPSGGFALGGWLVPFMDDLTVVDSWFELSEAFLFGRTTYELMSGYWPSVTDPDNLVAQKLNTLPKYVASTTLPTVDWQNAQLLEGDVVEAIRAVKARDGGELQVHGCAELVQTLNAHGLVDEYRVLTFPVVLGSGKRLFDAGTAPMTLETVEQRPTPSGGSYMRLQPVGAIKQGEFSVTEGGSEASIL